MNSEKEKVKKSEFFYNKFNLDSDTLIVLAAGMICDEVCSFEIAQAIGNYTFKNKTKIIFHNRVKNSDENLYFDKVRAAGKENLCLSLDPVLFSELHSVFNSAQIGLVIYDTNNTDENFNAIGAASGKLYQYIKYGLPVIASNTEGFRELILENNLGIIVESPSEIPAAIEKIISNYQWYSSNAKTAFEEKLNIDIYLNKINDLI
jgi:glycosyltransferase involved in cell wall biosynthesis